MMIVFTVSFQIHISTSKKLDWTWQYGTLLKKYHLLNIKKLLIEIFSEGSKHLDLHSASQIFQVTVALRAEEMFIWIIHGNLRVSRKKIRLY